MMNVVSLEQVRRELSEVELYRLAMLRNWLMTGQKKYLPQKTKLSPQEYLEDQLKSEMTFRSAPSITIRSEAELFGINMPRFGYRAMIHQDKKNPHEDEILAAVNIRRIESFIKSVGERLEVSAQVEFLSKLKSKCSFLADSIIGIPPWTKETGTEYDILTTNLAPWYAESSPMEATSFVTHFPVGGGMCAQAVCFMVSSLLHEHARGVYGVAEVTSLANERQPAGFEPSEKPDKEEQLEFLNFSGLNVRSLLRYFEHPEVGLSARAASDTDDYDQVFASEKSFGTYLTHFLEQGAPVIVVCDIKKLKQTVYKKLPYQVGQQTDIQNSPELHSLLVVGKKKRTAVGEDPREYLVHDPATFPYFPMSAADIFESLKTLKQKDLIVVSHSQEVLNSLLEQSHNAESSHVQSIDLPPTSETQQSSQNDKTNELKVTPVPLKPSVLSSFCLDDFKSLITLSEESDALTEPLLCGTEYYVWMQSEVDNLIGTLFLKTDKRLEINAVDALSSIAPNGPLIDIIIERYKTLSNHTQALQPIALASFIPEISSSPHSERGKKAQRSLTFLGWLAVKMHEAQAENGTDRQLSRIEIVAGSRIGKVYQSLPHQHRTPEFIAEILPLTEVFHNVSSNLKSVLKSPQLSQALIDRNICYVLEQEPGPLFTLGTFDSLEVFCKQFLEKGNSNEEDREFYKDFKKLVGLNLDIAHWSMSGIDCEKFEDAPAIWMRIAHAHISGHHPSAHYGDTSLRFVQQQESHWNRYRSMVRLLQKYASKEHKKNVTENGYPGYSGYISLEFEAAPSMEILKESLNCARQLVTTVEHDDFENSDQG